MWRFFRRRRAPKFRPFDRKSLPQVEPLSFEETFSDGLLVAEAAGRMALKNRIILMALRGEEPFDAARASAAAREVLYELMQETDEVAEWSAQERKSASSRVGRSAHQHDYHREDAANLRMRERVNTAIAERLGELREDPEYLEAFAERARQDAWTEIAGVIDARLARDWAEYEIDEDYVRDRKKRMRDVTADLKRDLREVVRRRETLDELDDSFGAW